MALNTPCRRLLAGGCMLLMAGACTLPTGRKAAPAPSVVASLEAVYRSGTLGPRRASLLAGAHLFQGRAAEARAVLARARERVPDDAGMVLLEGLALEALGYSDSARVAYRSYLESSPKAPYGPEARARMERLDRARLDSTAAELLRGPAASRPPDPRRAAVLPFQVDTADARLSALAAALTEQLCADLAMTRWLEVADRATVAALSRVVPAPPSGSDRPAVAENVGRLLGAGMVVRGRLGWAPGDSLTLEGDLLLLGASDVEVVTFRDTLDLDALPGVELGFAASIHERVGLGQPFQAVRPATRGSTGTPEAWLDFGSGIMALDAGRYATAESLFSQAHGRDTGFRRAQELARRARYFEASAQPPGKVAWMAAQVGVQHELVRALRGAPGPTYHGLSTRLGRRERATLSELLGLDPAGGGAVLELLLAPRKAGGP